MRHSRLAALVATLLAAVITLAAPTTAPAGSAPPAQTASLRALPQLADAGTTPSPAAAALTTLEAAFTPVVPGRTAILQAKRGRQWVETARGSQDSGGRVSFQSAYALNGVPETYRVLAARDQAYKETASGSVRTDAWGTPIFSDEFAGTTLSPPWDHRYQGYEVPSRSCSKTDPRATAVGGGVLALRVLDDPDRDDACTFALNGQQQSTFHRINGHVGTQGRFSYRYGVAAARVKFHDPRGQHGAFWLQPQGSGYGAEIDVIEWFGNGSGGLTNSVWDYSSGTPVRVAGGWVPDQPSFGSDWAGSYHVFSVEWTPSEYVFRIDGKVSLRTGQGVAQTEEYLILSLLVSNWEIPNLPSPQSLPATMDVDWVRVWQKG
ncbi:glycoside hydrolase family 16 protein [Nocardioides piscis]|uniref:Glycoside hydrolase family 16 protein n=1 Tax=Nocardioides piscis TaxID=2714938 RepID=A0A6G7YEM2_9ACTN|nr:glycoside hydrolase family 16 protein [Nocardioides piscis]QIK75255.1 glycoside hydrolase family 16 protein [Nocardioides piscis]